MRRALQSGFYVDNISGIIMNVEIINIGTELMFGRIVNTNASFIASRLAMIGLEAAFQVSVGDNELRATTILNQALGRAGIIIVTGGLGSTQDDITRGVLAKVLNRELILDRRCLQKIETHFRERKLALPAGIEGQALVFKGARVIENRFGTAPGQIIEDGDKILVVMPGVPREMKAMFDEEVIPYLRNKIPEGAIIKSKFLKVFGLSESSAESLIKDIIIQSVNPEIGTICTDRELILRLTSRASSDKEATSLIASLEEKIRKRLGFYIFGEEDETMEFVVGTLLSLNRNTISVAESCTGGKVADLLTDIPGSSRYFERGIVCYSNRAKEELLDIPEKLITRKGAVSYEVCEAMAKNIRTKTGSDMGLSITGIAGPGGEHDRLKKPIGITYIGLDCDKKTSVREYIFKGPRKVIKEKMAYTALDTVRRYLLGAEVK